MKVTVLGYWGGYPYQQEGTSGYLVEADGYRLLVDAGSSTLVTLQEVVDPLKLDAVVLSHYHYDHIADLGVLQFYRQLRPSVEPVPVLPIYGHQEDQANFDRLTMPEISVGKAYQAEQELDLGPFKLRFLRTVHPVPCFALRIEEKVTGATVVYTADSGYLEAFFTFAEAADLLIADAYFLNGREKNPVHFTAKEVGEIARKAHVKEVLLSHLQQDIDQQALLTQVSQELRDPAVPITLAKRKWFWSSTN